MVTDLVPTRGPWDEDPWDDGYGGEAEPPTGLAAFGQKPEELLQRALERWAGGLSRNTARAYQSDVAAWRAWCDARGVDFGHPTGRDMVEYLAGLNLKEATRARRYSGIRSFYAWARDEGLTDADPLPPRAQRPRAQGMDAARLGGLTEAQARDLMAAADASSPRLAALVALLLTTGLRISEALSIDQLAVQPGRTVVTVLGKGRKTRTVVVPAFAAERCASLLALAPNDRQAAPNLGVSKQALARPLFVTRTGRRLSPREAWDSIRRLGVRAGIPHLHPHMLRHTAATLALMDGANIQAVRAMLGHSSLGTTQRYVEAAGTLDNSPAYALAAKIAPKESHA